MKKNTEEEVFEYLLFLVKNEAKIEKSKAETITAQFGSLESFTNTNFLTSKLIRMDKTEIKLNEAQRARIEELKKFVNISAAVRQNWIWFLAHRFIKTQFENIQSLSLSAIIANPFLIRALNLTSPDEVVRFNVYQTATRSIVTSMGFALEMMVAHSGGRKGEKGEWYDVVKEVGDITYWIQVKSGPNDVDADQLRKFSQNFDKTEKKKNNLARLGITYGKRGMETISLTLMKSYLNKWEERLLLGKELWDFVSEEKDYHVFVLDAINEISTKLLKGSSIEKEIEDAISRIISEFESKYGKGKTGVDKYLNKIM